MTSPQLPNDLELDLTDYQVPRYIAVEGPIGVGKPRWQDDWQKVLTIRRCWKTPKKTRFLSASIKTPAQRRYPHNCFFCFNGLNNSMSSGRAIYFSQCA